jgi:hypothetical protein
MSRFSLVLWTATANRIRKLEKATPYFRRPLHVQANLRWVGVDLTVAMDWYSRCITGLRLTPVSTKSIDAAAVLYQSFRPMAAGKDWPRRVIVFAIAA